MHLFDRSERISNPGLSSNGSIDIIREGEHVSNYSILRNDLRKHEQSDTNYAIVKGVPPNSSLGLTEYDD